MSTGVDTSLGTEDTMMNKTDPNPSLIDPTGLPGTLTWGWGMGEERENILDRGHRKYKSPAVTGRS